MLAKRPPCRAMCTTRGWLHAGGQYRPSFEVPLQSVLRVMEPSSGGSLDQLVPGSGDVFGDGKTVIRGGYGLTYGRLNGVDLVLVPLLGTGLIQPVQCISTLLSNGTCGSPRRIRANAFPCQTDGLVAPIANASPTLPQPSIPGVNAIAAGAAGEALDPNFRPNSSAHVTVTFARQINNNMRLEIGYIGRIIKNEYMPVNLNAVPYMMTKGGQTFANGLRERHDGILRQRKRKGHGLAAIARQPRQSQPQPFFETALAGTRGTATALPTALPGRSCQRGQTARQPRQPERLEPV